MHTRKQQKLANISIKMVKSVDVQEALMQMHGKEKT
jgi:hypothetical protein